MLGREIKKMKLNIDFIVLICSPTIEKKNTFYDQQRKKSNFANPPFKKRMTP